MQKPNLAPFPNPN